MTWKSVRTVLFWCHLATAVCVAAIVLLMSATGVLLTYQRQTVAWLETMGLPTEAPPGGARPLPVDSLLASARRAVRGAPTTVTWRAASPRLAEVAIGREQVLYLDAYSGALLARSDPAVRTFFSRVTDWHRWLGAGTADAAARKRGRTVTGAANLGFLFIVASGLLLWWPRNWTPAAVRSVALPRLGLRGKARDFNWHHVIGLWSFVPLFIVVLSGTVISYPWASNLVYRAFGEQPPAPAAPAPREREPVAGAPTAGVDALLEHARGREPAWRSIALTVPRAPGAILSVAIDRGTGGEPQKRGTLTLDPATGTERWQPFASQSAGRRARSILRFAHTGEVLGVVGQTIAGLVSLGAVVLVWTGLALSLRRLAGWWRRRAAY